MSCVFMECLKCGHFWYKGSVHSCCPKCGSHKTFVDWDEAEYINYYLWEKKCN